MQQNETWADLARIHLGDARRAETLARANGGVSWVQPAAAQEIEVPAVVAIIAAEGETVPQLAGRYLGDLNKGWEIDGYNNRKDRFITSTLYPQPVAREVGVQGTVTLTKSR